MLIQVEESFSINVPPFILKVPIYPNSYLSFTGNEKYEIVFLMMNGWFLQAYLVFERLFDFDIRVICFISFLFFHMKICKFFDRLYYSFSVIHLDKKAFHVPHLFSSCTYIYIFLNKYIYICMYVFFTLVSGR